MFVLARRAAPIASAVFHGGPCLSREIDCSNRVRLLEVNAAAASKGAIAGFPNIGGVGHAARNWQ